MIAAIALAAAIAPCSATAHKHHKHSFVMPEMNCVTPRPPPPIPAEPDPDPTPTPLVRYVYILPPPCAPFAAPASHWWEGWFYDTASIPQYGAPSFHSIRAPEIGISGMPSAITLLCGLLAVIRSRK